MAPKIIPTNPIITRAVTLRHGSEFPLLTGSKAHKDANKAYPRTVTFVNGIQPLFIGGIVSKTEIDTICAGIAATIANRFLEQHILLVQVLEGARPFCRQVFAYLKNNFPALSHKTAAIKVQSYTNGSQASAHKISQPLHDKNGRISDLSEFDTIVILDDLLDMGNTVHWLVTDYLAKLAVRQRSYANAPPTQAFFMLEKERQRTTEVNEILIQSRAVSGCLVPDEWVVGFGLDINLPGAPGQDSLHLFRDELPGGIYAFNSAIEQELITKYQTDPATQLPSHAPNLTEQLKIYASDI
jgi:hypoxanthine-guanine phosphoribosyltransferase